MSAMDAGSATGEVARTYQLKPEAVGECRAEGDLPALDDARRIAELERKVGQLTIENDSLKKGLQHFRDHHPPAVVGGADVCLKKSSKLRRKATP